MDPMKQALMQRRGKGMDLQILINGQPVITASDAEQKKSDLAPPNDEGDDSQPEPGEGSVDEEVKDASEPSDDDQFSKEMTEGMGDQDLERKPQSLGDRARMDAFKRLKK